jgi:hypothetical protein
MICDKYRGKNKGPQSVNEKLKANIKIHLSMFYAICNRIMKVIIHKQTTQSKYARIVMCILPKLF